jgi:hypothetical protein
MGGKKYNTPDERRLARILSGIKSRCYNPNATRAQWYHGKGVKVCDEWLKRPFAFIWWALDNGYEDGLTIDRIDPDGDYSPDNCRWLSRSRNSARTYRPTKAAQAAARKWLIEK